MHASSWYALTTPDRNLLPFNATYLPTFIALHKDYPLVCRWFITLAQRDHFTSAVWKASNDVGFDAFHSFVKGAKKSHSVPVESDGVLQVKGKGQNLKPSKHVTGSKSKSSSQQVPKKAVTTEDIVGCRPLSATLSSSLSLSLHLSPLIVGFLCTAY